MLISRQYSIHRAFAERGLELNQRELAKVHEQMATGLTINRPSDDPSGFSVAKKLTASMSGLGQYLRNIESTLSWFAQGQDSLDQAANIFTLVREKGIQGANATTSAGDREILANEIEGQLNELVDILNGKNGDRYLFAGTRNNVKPFELDGLDLVYHGNENNLMRRIGDDTTISAGLHGASIVNLEPGLRITDTIRDLIVALRNDDSNAVSNQLGEIERAQDHVLHKASDLGSRSRRVNLAADQLRETQIALKAERSHIQDADYVETLTRFQQLQINYQAALQTTASILQTSLVDYLR